MNKEKERAEMAIQDIVTTISINTNDLYSFGYELRKADKVFKLSNRILEKGSKQMGLYEIILR